MEQEKWIIPNIIMNLEYWLNYEQVDRKSEEKGRATGSEQPNPSPSDSGQDPGGDREAF